MPDVPCFWLEPTDRVQVGLRRYAREESREPCLAPESYGYHNALVKLETRPALWKTEVWGGKPGRFLERHTHSYMDPRWPRACACGYVFNDADEWQVWQELIYARADTRELLTLRDAPGGAMWDAWWMGDHWRGADGIALCVKLPSLHDWVVDGPSFENGKIKNARGWTRSGAPPLVTAHPSIRVPGKKNGQPDRYHGWLRHGVLAAC